MDTRIGRLGDHVRGQGESLARLEGKVDSLEGKVDTLIAAFPETRAETPGRMTRRTP